jgi:hemoglobin
MLMRNVLGATAILALATITAGCPSPASTDAGVDGGRGDTGPGGDGGPMDATTSTGGMSIFQKIGGDMAVAKVIDSFVGNVLANPEINGYFLNADLDDARLVKCLNKQVKFATGGGGSYPASSAMGDQPADTDTDGCRSMKLAHKGLKISKAEFDALVGDLDKAMMTNGVMTAERDAIKGELAKLAGEIIEDMNNNGTIYQRIGRNKNIEKLIGEFATAATTDVMIKDFFDKLTGGADKGPKRLGVCLVRQVCAATGGPCQYDKANKYVNDLKTDMADAMKVVNCRTMEETHDKVMNPNVGGTMMKDITIADFNALINDFANTPTFKAINTKDAMDKPDSETIANVLKGLCNKIVRQADRAMCP